MELPTDFADLQDSGVLDRLRNPDDPLAIWDVNFILAEPFEPLKDQVLDICPFARSAGGDFWGYITSRLPDPTIYQFYRDSYEAETVAGNLGELVFRQAVTFSSVENLTEGEWTIEAARGYLARTITAFREFLTAEMRLELARLQSTVPIRNIRWMTLISEQEAEELVERYLKVPKELLAWRG